MGGPTANQIISVTIHKGLRRPLINRGQISLPIFFVTVCSLGMFWWCLVETQEALAIRANIWQSHVLKMSYDESKYDTKYSHSEVLKYISKYIVYT